jgi:hypothetical protein
MNNSIYLRDRYHADIEYREMIKERARQQYAKNSADPTWCEKHRERTRAGMAACRERWKQWGQWAIVFACVASPAAAQECPPYGLLADTLLRQARQEPLALALDEHGRVMRLFAARDGSGWTIAAVSPDGRACIVMQGTALELTLPTADGTPA